jgi:hypothetical protein
MEFPGGDISRAATVAVLETAQHYIMLPLSLASHADARIPAQKLQKIRRLRRARWKAAALSEKRKGHGAGASAREQSDRGVQKRAFGSISDRNVASRATSRCTLGADWFRGDVAGDSGCDSGVTGLRMGNGPGR